MAYPYPSAEGAGSSSSLVGAGHGHGHGQGHHGHGHAHGHSVSARSDVSRKASEGDNDVLQAFKKKIEEDEAYISFFQERLNLEEQYISGLNKLHSKHLAMDTLQEDGPRKGPKPTVRRAWVEIIDYTQREAQSREAMVSAVREDVLKDLVKMRDTQSRIRQGLKENLRVSSDQYEDHLKGTLTKLRKSYWSKCQAVEEHKRQENAIAMQAKLLSQPTSPNQGPSDYPGQLTISPPSTSGPLPPMSNPALSQAASSENTSPSKTGRLRAGSASAHGSGHGQDNRTKEVFNDIAQQSKRGFSAFMQKLGGDSHRDKEKEEGGFVVVGSPEMEGSGSGSGIQRRGTIQGIGMKGASARQMGQLKTKREAEEADKAYRAAVFHLESLRLRRDKVQQSALQNLDSFSDDLNKQVRAAMERYVDTMHGTGATVAQSTEVARHAIQAVNLDHDMSLWRSRINSTLANHKIEPVPYHNFYVGECRSLIFGVSLTDYDFTRPEGTQNGEPPIIVEKCIAAVDERGLDSEGIYRVSGRKTGVQQMVQGVERDEAKFTFSEKDDVFSVTNVLKQYLRELPEPVFPLPHPERVKHTKERETHIHSNFSALRGRLRRLPPIHQTTFRALIEHLGRVQAHAGQNKMDAKNLAVVFNSVIFGHDQVPVDGNVLTMTQEKDTVLEDLITYSDLLFSEMTEPQAPNLLPPGSSLTRTGAISFHPVEDGPHPGSSRTRVQIVNADTTSIHRSRSPLDQVTSPEILAQAHQERERETGVARSMERERDNTVIVVDSPATPTAEPESTMPNRSFTRDDQLEVLFDSGLIPASMREGLPDQYHVRPLASDDLLRGHFALLSTLTTSPALAPSLYSSLFQYLKALQGTYYVVVFVNKSTDELVASATLVVERKHIHGGGIAGHIEDVVVAPQCRGTGVGVRLISGLRELGVLVGCYKVILDCREDRVGFYEKCGFIRRGIQMAHYASNLDISPATAPVPALPPRTSSMPNQQQQTPLQIPQHGSHLALPELRSTSPLPAIGLDQSIDTVPNEIDLASETQSVSSTAGAGAGEGVDYNFPTTAHTGAGNNTINLFRNPFTPAFQTSSPPLIHTTTTVTPTSTVTALTGTGTGLAPAITSPATEADEAQLERPAWAEEGLGSDELSSVPVPTGLSPTRLGGVESERIGSGSESPLPPGAAPPRTGTEPERSGTL